MTKKHGAYNSPLQVVGYVATRRGDEDRGPWVRMREDEAVKRLVTDGELVWVMGPRGKALAPCFVDPAIPRGGVVVRDLPGIGLTDIVRVVKVDMDRVPRPASLA